jgi:GH35 family endo-1,4-beta-xylanase
VAQGGISAFKLAGPHAQRVKISSVPVQGQAFDTALRADVVERSGLAWDVQLQAPTSGPVESGDALLATFSVRCTRSLVESGEGQTEFVFELARDPWTKSISYPVKAGREWLTFNVRFMASGSYGPGDAQLIFRLGYAPETIEIGGVSVKNFGKRLRVEDLPETRISYRGREPDAPWRALADQRIEQHRKAELAIAVRDAAGKPLPGARVSAKLIRHAFLFGSAVNGNYLAAGGADPELPRYQREIARLFNVATLENELKWQPLAGDWGPPSLPNAEKAIAWLQSQRIPVRGHVLVWPSWRNLPRALQALKDDKPRLREAVKQHIRETVTRMRGKLIHWDVINEPFDNHDLMDLLGDEEMVTWFKEARAADPSAKLFINDYAILEGGGGPNAHDEHYEKTIKYLLDRGAPVDAIGMQGHFGLGLTSPDDLLGILDRYARFGKPIHVTEYDIVLNDEQLAGDYTRDFLTLIFSHPAVEGFVMWGFWDGRHWKNAAPLFRKDWSLKPSGVAYEDLVLKRWTTAASGTTDASGRFAARGFLGEYEIEARHGALAKKSTATLTRDGKPVVVTLQ